MEFYLQYGVYKSMLKNAVHRNFSVNTVDG